MKRAAAEGEKAVSGWSDGIKNFAAAAAALLPPVALIAVGRQMVALSRRIEDLDRKSKIVFEDQLGDIKKWAAANRRAFGLSSREVVGLAADMSDLLKPMGFTAKQAADMSKKLLNLAGALSKWSRGTKTAAEVSDILTKALLGEREELKSLGISINAAEVQARLLSKGQQDLTGTALQQAEALATQELIYEKSTDAQKAWAEGGKAAAEAQGTLSSSVNTLKEKLAVLLGPAIAGVTTKLGEFAEKAVVKFDEIAPRIQKFVDTELSGLKTSLIDLKDNVLAGVKQGFDDLKVSVDSNAQSWQSLRDGIASFVDTAGPAIKFLVNLIITSIAAALDWAATLIDAVKFLIDIFKRATEGWQKLIDKIRGTRGGGAIFGAVTRGGSSGFQARAHGGPVVANRDYLVGEEGPEILRMGSRSGTIIPNHEVGRSGDDPPMVIHNHIEVGGEVVRTVETVVKRTNRNLKRAVLARAGAR